MKKYLNEKNIYFIAHVATSNECFNSMKAIDLCIDEWYLGNSINEDVKYRGAAKYEFNKLLFGRDFTSKGKTHQSEIMVNALTEFFELYIAPKYILLQKFTYNFLNNLEKNDVEDVFKSGLSFLDYDYYKMQHNDDIIDLVRDKITDWHFGFEIKDPLYEEEVEIVSKPIEKKVATKKKATTKKSKK